jgi:hypothetical protein
VLRLCTYAVGPPIESNPFGMLIKNKVKNHLFGSNRDDSSVCYIVACLLPKGPSREGLKLRRRYSYRTKTRYNLSGLEPIDLETEISSSNSLVNTRGFHGLNNYLYLIMFRN